MTDYLSPDQIRESLKGWAFKCPCAQCGAQMRIEEWMIWPYVVLHGTCPTHGPQWKFIEGTPQAVIDEVSTIPAPHYRDTIPNLNDLCPSFRAWIQRLRMAWVLDGHHEFGGINLLG